MNGKDFAAPFPPHDSLHIQLVRRKVLQTALHPLVSHPLPVTLAGAAETLLTYRGKIQSQF